MSLDIGLVLTPQCPCCHAALPQYSDYVFQLNLTHNLVPMAKESGLFDCVWRPDENHRVYAHEIIPDIEAGIERLKQDPFRYIALNPSNGCGSYQGFLRFLGEYLAKCREYPEALIEVDR